MLDCIMELLVHLNRDIEQLQRACVEVVIIYATLLVGT